jgi:hypothetical protein
MSSLAGWQGSVPDGNRILQRMAEVMSGPSPQVVLHPGSEFAVATTQPAVAGDVQRVASSDDGQVTVAFAGYLYTEDRQERSSPAQHCLKLYEQNGPMFAEKLNGSFAIVISDRRVSQVHLVRDRIGTRPLFYSAGPPFLFASEVKAILEFPGVSREVNPNVLVEFLVRQRVVGPATYYDHIQRAPAASVTTWDGAETQSVRYWRPPFGAEKCPDLMENARRAHQAMQNATRRTCFGAERPALMLSGGLDSRGIALACPTPLLCLTLHAHPGYEVQTARRVAEALGYEHQFVPLPASFPLELVTEGSLIGDGMNGFRHAQGLYLTETLRAREVGAVLNGASLEVLLSEFLLPRRHWRLSGRECIVPWLEPEERLDVARTMWQTWSLADEPTVRRLVKRDRLDEAAGPAFERIEAFLSTLEGGATDPYLLHAFTLLADTSCSPYYLNLQAVDRLAPTLRVAADTELIDLFFTIPPRHRLAHRLYASLHTQVDRRCRWIPYTTTGLPMSNLFAPWECVAGYLHRALFRALHDGVSRVSRRQARKLDRGSWPREGLGIRDWPAWHTYLRRRVDSSRLVDMGLLAGDSLRRLVDDQIAGSDASLLIVATWVTLEEWLASYG